MLSAVHGVYTTFGQVPFDRSAALPPFSFLPFEEPVALLSRLPSGTRRHNQRSAFILLQWRHLRPGLQEGEGAGVRRGHTSRFFENAWRIPGLFTHRESE